MSESVNHPKHYNVHPSGVECIDVIEHMSFNAGNCIKYLWRAGIKRSSIGEEAKYIEDLRKASWYAAREVQRVEKLIVDRDKAVDDDRSNTKMGA